MAKTNKLSPKVELYSAIANAIYRRRCEILQEKQIIPWAESKVGPCYAVTKDALVGGMEGLRDDIVNILREFKVSFESTES